MFTVLKNGERAKMAVVGCIPTDVRLDWSEERAMTVQSVTVELPATLYNRLKRRAEKAQRTIEAEVVEAVTEALPNDEDLSPALQQAMAHLATLDDNALWRAATAQFSDEKSSRLEALHFARQDGDWDEMKAHEAASLVAEIDQFMFLRAHALSLLIQRGHDISTLFRQ
jgi:plasmid stability protein